MMPTCLMVVSCRLKVRSQPGRSRGVAPTILPKCYSGPTNVRGTFMKLGLSIGYSRAHLEIPVELVQRAEQLGYDSVWTAEAYGSDAVTPLAFLAAKTSRIKLGTGIMQLAARTPANAAMSAATVDAMAGGGRFIAGIGVAGPPIVGGGEGQPGGRPDHPVEGLGALIRKDFSAE